MLSMKAIDLRAEIIRLKTELEDRCLEIRTLKVDLEQWKSGFEKMAESDRLETEERVHWEERAEKAERELAELQECVAWYFECLEFAEFMSGAVSWHCDSFDEAMDSRKHVEQQLREIIGDE